MKQLDNKVSSPWEIKKGEASSPALDTQWSKVHEEPEPPKPKYNNRFAILRIPGLGSNAINVGPLHTVPTQEYIFPMGDTGVSLTFTLSSIDADGDGHYDFKGLQL